MIVRASCARLRASCARLQASCASSIVSRSVVASKVSMVFGAWASSWIHFLEHNTFHYIFAVSNCDAVFQIRYINLKSFLIWKYQFSSILDPMTLILNRFVNITLLNLCSVGTYHMKKKCLNQYVVFSVCKFFLNTLQRFEPGTFYC